MALRGFDFRVTDQKVLRENDLRGDRYYTPNSMDGEFYYITNSGGMEIEIPHDAVVLKTEENKHVING